MGVIPPFLLYETMNETDYKNLIITYQQKSFDLFSQVVALEANTNNQISNIQAINNIKGVIFPILCFIP